jgi:hypothetical protein
MILILIERYVFILFLVLGLYIITINPNNFIPYILYFSLFYIPVNLLVIYQKRKDKIEMPDFELAHRLMFITIGIIPVLSIISQPIKDLLRFQ